MDGMMVPSNRIVNEDGIDCSRRFFLKVTEFRTTGLVQSGHNYSVCLDWSASLRTVGESNSIRKKTIQLGKK